MDHLIYLIISRPESGKHGSRYAGSQKREEHFQDKGGFQVN